MKKHLFLVAGKPGSGKTTASALAAGMLTDAYHFSIGDELRARALHDKPSRHSKQLKQYADELRQHLPVPPHLPPLVVEECLETSPAITVIVDGYPQYADRLPGFYESLERADAEVLAICVIDVSDGEARKRLNKREQRSADVAEDNAYIQKRLDGFYKNVITTLNALSARYPVYTLDGSRPPDEVAEALTRFIRDYV